MFHSKYFLLILLSVSFLSSCNSNNEGNGTTSLNKSEIAVLRSAVEKIDDEQIVIFHQKIKKLSEETLPISNADIVRNLESYKDIFNWIRNNINNFPLLFQYLIYDEKIVGEERSNTVLLLWDLCDEIYPSVTEEMRNTDNFNSIDLIRKLLHNY